MAKLLQNLPLLSLLALFLVLTNTVNSQQSQDTTSFTYDNFYANSVGLTYQGDANFPSGSTKLRLTKTDSSGNPQRGSIGRVVYSNPVKFWESQPARQASFETTIKFFITPTNNNPADGIAFFFAPVGYSIPSGSSGGNLGIFSSAGTASSVFAVEFDTYVNGQWDPSYRHIGIDINSRQSVNVTRFDNMLSREVTARINYEATTRRLSVVATVGSERHELNYVYDLKSILPQQVQVGISASTGEEVSIHDINAWYFTSTLVRENPSVQDNNENDNSYIRQYVM